VVSLRARVNSNFQPSISWSEKLLLLSICHFSTSVQTADLLENALKSASKKLSDLQICQILGNGGFLERVKTLPDEFSARAKDKLKEKLALEFYDDLNELKVLCALVEVEALDFNEMREILADLNLEKKSLSDEARMNILLVLQIMAEEEEIWDELPKMALRKWFFIDFFFNPFWLNDLELVFLVFRPFNLWWEKRVGVRPRRQPPPEVAGGGNLSGRVRGGFVHNCERRSQFDFEKF
jgi:hypothetical protein